MKKKIYKLHLAVKAGDKKRVRKLLDQDWDPNELNDEGYPPLIWAVCWGSGNVLELLREYGADPSICDSEGNSLAWHIYQKGWSVPWIQ